MSRKADNREAGAAVLLRGPAGIGKSALLDDAVRRAGPSRRILRTVGAPPETGLAIAGLYQLLQPLLPLAHLIPEPRQAALRVAFGIVDGAPPEPFAVAMAALDLLVDAAAEQPLLVVAEDVQWLDPATLGVLRFIARRLEHDPVVLLPGRAGRRARSVRRRHPRARPAAAQGRGRTPAPRFGRAGPGRLGPGPDPSRRRGQPARAGGAAEDPGLALRPAGGPEWLPLTQRLQGAFAARIELLPAATRIALLLEALHDSPSLPELLDALGPDGTPAETPQADR